MRTLNKHHHHHHYLGVVKILGNVVFEVRSSSSTYKESGGLDSTIRLY
jgi:hypothetical protein